MCIIYNYVYYDSIAELSGGSLHGSLHGIEGLVLVKKNAQWKMDMTIIVSQYI